MLPLTDKDSISWETGGYWVGQEGSYNLWKPKIYYVFIRSMHRTLFCVSWIKSKIVHSFCIRFFNNTDYLYV